MILPSVASYTANEFLEQYQHNQCAESCIIVILNQKTIDWNSTMFLVIVVVKVVRFDDQ